MTKSTQFDILKNILNIFHNTVQFTAEELQLIDQFLFKDHDVDFVLNTEDVYDTIKYLKDIMVDHDIHVVEDLAMHFKKKEEHMQVFIEKVLDKLDNEEHLKLPARDTRIIHVEGGLYSIDKSYNNEVSYLIEYYQRSSVDRPVEKTIAHCIQWDERILFIDSSIAYLFYFREYYFRQIEFADWQHIVSPFGILEGVGNISLSEWYNALVGLEDVVLIPYHQISVMESFFQFMVDSQQQQQVQKVQVTNKVEGQGVLKTIKQPKTPLEEKISYLIRCAKIEFQQTQNLDKENDIDNYLDVEGGKLSNPLFSLNR